MIYQGSNDNIVLEFPESMKNIEDFSALLYYDSKIFKHWTLNDITINKSEIYLPITQEESVQFQKCKATLEVKFLKKGSDTVTFADKAEIDIVSRKDKTIMKRKIETE